MFKTLYKAYSFKQLYGRYITNAAIAPILKSDLFSKYVTTLGYSVNLKPIYGVKIGNGSINVLLWSQMHGNESTTTKALLDVLNVFLNKPEQLKKFTILAIPILNPDGAERYTRANANDVDLNRDAVKLTQPESKVLREMFNTFQPDFCFNLHGQRSIFGVDGQNTSAAMSFLAPAFNESLDINITRAKAMAVIADIDMALRQFIPNQVGLYDDAFNANCVGDTFQALNVPTVLFEAGHYRLDYEREETRFFVFVALLEAFKSIDLIVTTNVINTNRYHKIPINVINFCDILIKNAVINGEKNDIAITYQEYLVKNVIKFKPKIVKITHHCVFLGHKIIQADQKNVTQLNGAPLKEGLELKQLKIGDSTIKLTPRLV